MKFVIRMPKVKKKPKIRLRQNSRLKTTHSYEVRVTASGMVHYDDEDTRVLFESGSITVPCWFSKAKVLVCLKRQLEREYRHEFYDPRIEICLTTGPYARTARRATLPIKAAHIQS